MGAGAAGADEKRSLASEAHPQPGRKTHPPHPYVYSINLQSRRSEPDVGSSRSFSQDKHAEGPRVWRCHQTVIETR